jgi:dinuclear metal center YbgI/SA1388 family protein
MIQRDALVGRLNDLLAIQDVTADWCPNGLQVQGTGSVSRVATGVTASLAFIEAARDAGAQAIVVHHGIFWNHASPVLVGSHAKRVRALLESDISLCGYHLPLDRHPEVGNNAPALRELGCDELQPFAWAKGVSVGWRGCFAEPISPQELLDRIRAVYGVDTPTAFLEGPDEIRTMGLVSGAAQGELGTAVGEGLDAFVTGEVSEHNFHVAREEGIHHVSIGHHASERVGPRCLARWINQNLDVDAEFIDIPNPV